jgi:hypothetical protein
LQEEAITDPEKVKAVCKWSQTIDKHELWSFLGLWTYQHGFTTGCANIAKPLTKFTEEMQTFQFSPEAETAF